MKPGSNGYGGHRYLRVTLINGVVFYLRVIQDDPTFLVGTEVTKTGDEVVPKGTNFEGKRWTERARVSLKSAIKDVTEMRMSHKYGELMELAELLEGKG